MADTSSDVIGGRYRVLGNLGKGAMGLVYMAHDPVLDRKVAIKQMTAEIADNEELRKRFYIEARAAARLNHPNIITIHELQESGGDIFMIMELLEGKSLAALIQAKPVPLAIEATLDVMAQVCDGLDYAHQRTIVHRDIKPANLFLTPSGTVKILDFGIARLGSLQMTAAGALIGTPDYMSPEQIRGDQIDRRTDLWAVGAVLYQLLSGTKPFEGRPLTKLLTAISQTPHIPLQQRAPAVPRSVTDLVDRLLAKPRDGRPASAGLVRDELRAILGRESSSSTKATLAEDEYEETVFMSVPVRSAAPPVPPAPKAPVAAPPPPPAQSAVSGKPEEVEQTVLMRVPKPATPSAPATPPPPSQAAASAPPKVVAPSQGPADKPAAAPLPPPLPAAPPVRAQVPPAARPAVAAPVTPAPPAPAPPRAQGPAPASARRGMPLLAAVAIVAVLCLAVAGGAAWWFLGRGGPEPATGDATTAAGETPTNADQAPSAATQPAAAPATAVSTPPAVNDQPVVPTPSSASPQPAVAEQPLTAPPRPAPSQPADAGTSRSGAVPPRPSAAAPGAAPQAAAPRGGIETGVAGAVAERPGVSADTLETFKGRPSGGGEDSAATVAAVNRINYVLEQYVRALVNADAEAIRDYRPTLSPSESALMRARELKIRLEDLRVDVDGTSAVARCRRRINGVSATGTRIDEDSQVTFQLTRRPAGWVITDVR